MFKENQLNYKIISFGSQSPDLPITNILQPEAYWQSSRFCTYPQQITIKFDRLVNIQKLQFLAHRYMIPNRIDILHLNSQSTQPNLFYKYGYVRFSSNEQTNFQARQQKTLQVDITCDHMRFLFQAPHKNRMNFFSQVGLEQLIISSSKDVVLKSTSQFQPIQQKSNIQIFKQTQKDEFIVSKIRTLQKEKQQAVRQQRYDEAQRIKDIINNIIGLRSQLQLMIVKKQRAVEVQNYDQAKRIKIQIERIRNGTQDIIKSYLQGTPIDQQFINVHEETQDKQDLNQFVQQMIYENQQNQVQKQKSHTESRFVNRQIPFHKQIINYDERIIPAILNKDKPPITQDQLEQSKLPQQPEQLDFKAAKHKHIMQVFGQNTARRFFSKHWQFRLQAVNTITSQLDVPKQSKDKQAGLKCLAFLEVILDGSKQSVFQICQAALHLCLKFIQNKTIQPIKGQIQYDNILFEITKRLSDGNIKLRGMAEQIFKRMATSPSYGVGMCSSMLIKTLTSSSKPSNLQIQQRLDFLTFFINHYGLGQGNVPLSAIEFATTHIIHQNPSIRNSSFDLLVSSWLVGNQDKVKPAIDKLKQQISKQFYRRIQVAQKDRQFQKKQGKAKQSIKPKSNVKK